MAESKHEHGKMDISAQEKTFQGFMRFTTNTVIAIVVLLIFLGLVAI